MTGKPDSLLKVLFQLAVKEKRNLVVVSNQELADILGVSESGFRVVRARLASMKLIEFGNQADHVGRGIKTWYRLKKPPSAPSLRLEKYGALYIRYILPLPDGSLTVSTTRKGVMGDKRRKGAESEQSKRRRLKTELSESFGPAEQVVLLKRASGIIGTPSSPYTAYGRRCKKTMLARLLEGYSVDDLVRACEYAAKEWDNGDKWRQLKDLCYIWGRGFQVSLATKGQAGKSERRQPEFAKGEDREKWLDDIKRRTEGA